MTMSFTSILGDLDLSHDANIGAFNQIYQQIQIGQQQSSTEESRQ